MYLIASKLSRIIDYVARILIGAIMVSVVGNVILRKLGHPIDGTYELVGFLTATAIGLALANSEVREVHVTVTFLTERLSKKSQVITGIFINIIILILLTMVFGMMILYGKKMAITGEVGLTTEIPFYYFVYIIAFGFLSYFLVVLGKVINSIKKEGKG